MGHVAMGRDEPKFQSEVPSASTLRRAMSVTDISGTDTSRTRAMRTKEPPRPTSCRSRRPSSTSCSALADGDQHGYAIAQAVEELTGGTVRMGPGTLYGSIGRMVASGLLEESSRGRGRAAEDERRRFYRLTALGRRVLECGDGAPRIASSRSPARRTSSVARSRRDAPHRARVRAGAAAVSTGVSRRVRRRDARVRRGAASRAASRDAVGLGTTLVPPGRRRRAGRRSANTRRPGRPFAREPTRPSCPRPSPRNGTPRGAHGHAGSGRALRRPHAFATPGVHDRVRRHVGVRHRRHRRHLRRGRRAVVPALTVPQPAPDRGRDHDARHIAGRTRRPIRISSTGANRRGRSSRWP